MEKKVRKKEELEDLARKLIDQLRKEDLPMWQAKEVFTRAQAQLEWETLK